MVHCVDGKAYSENIGMKECGEAARNFCLEKVVASNKKHEYPENFHTMFLKGNAEHLRLIVFEREQVLRKRS